MPVGAGEWNSPSQAEKPHQGLGRAYALPSGVDAHVAGPLRQAPVLGHFSYPLPDFGVGIAAEDQAHIFEQFGKVSDRAELQGESHQTLGSGLGLHLCKGILEAHGGAVWVDSPGYDEESCPGSIFHLMIPVRKEPPDDPSIRFLGTSRA